MERVLRSILQVWGILLGGLIFRIGITYGSTWVQQLGVHIGVYQPCPDLKRTLVAMSERTGMTVSQVTDEVLYKGLIGMQEMDEL